MASMRATRSAMVPSLAWKVTPSSFFSQRSKLATPSADLDLSFSQKNCASLSRAVSTRALPSAMVLPPSVASILAMARKWGASLPVSGTRTAK